MKNILFICMLFCLFSETDLSAAKKGRPVPSQTTQTKRSIQSMEEECIRGINEVRQQYGKAPLKPWPQLGDCARNHSQNMACGKTLFGHQGFDDRFAEMQKKASLSYFGENVAYSHNYDEPVQIAIDGWMKSQGHRENILDDFEETGVGIAIGKDGKFYATQLFANRHRSR